MPAMMSVWFKIDVSWNPRISECGSRSGSIHNRDRGCGDCITRGAVRGFCDVRQYNLGKKRLLMVGIFGGC